jgi:hypothetical protein
LDVACKTALQVHYTSRLGSAAFLVADFSAQQLAHLGLGQHIGLDLFALIGHVRTHGSQQLQCIKNSGFLHINNRLNMNLFYCRFKIQLPRILFRQITGFGQSSRAMNSLDFPEGSSILFHMLRFFYGASNTRHHSAVGGINIPGRLISG